MSIEVFRSKNGSSTLLDSEAGETMHSALGPWREAQDVYVAQSPIPRNERSEVVLFDVGMGIAANSLALVSHLKDTSKCLSILSFERELKSIQLALGRIDQFEFLRPFVGVLESLLRQGEIEFIWQTLRIKWTLFQGDFQSQLKKGRNTFPTPDLIYYDMYSPRKAPELWTQDSFQLFSALRSEARDTSLITYCAASSVRRALSSSGFYVGIGNPTELKRETTLASTNLSLLKRPWKFRAPPI